MTRGLRATTIAGYEFALRQYIIPRIGNVLLQKLEPGHLNAMYADLKTKGRHDGKGGLSARSVRLAHTTMHKALKDAARWGKVQRNVAQLADPQSAQAARESAEDVRKWWSPQELAKFLAHARTHRLGAAYQLDAATGLRRGEVLGLRWRDLDLGKQPRLSVVQTRVVAANQVVTSRPKSKTSVRQVPLDATTAATLSTHRTTQLAERMQLGLGKPSDDDSVFTREDGEPLHPAVFSQIFEDLVAAAGVRKIRLHDLRHTFASIGLTAGVHPLVMSKLLGHYSTAFTMDVYSHIVPGVGADGVDAIAAQVAAAASADA